MQRKVLEVFITKMRNDLYDKSQGYVKDQSENKKAKPDTKEVMEQALKDYLKEICRFF